MGLATTAAILAGAGAYWHSNEKQAEARQAAGDLRGQEKRARMEAQQTQEERRKRLRARRTKKAEMSNPLKAGTVSQGGGRLVGGERETIG